MDVHPRPNFRITVIIRKSHVDWKTSTSCCLAYSAIRTVLFFVFGLVCHPSVGVIVCVNDFVLALDWTKINCAITAVKVICSVRSFPTLSEAHPTGAVQTHNLTNAISTAATKQQQKTETTEDCHSLEIKLTCHFGQIGYFWVYQLGEGADSHSAEHEKKEWHTHLRSEIKVKVCGLCPLAKNPKNGTYPSQIPPMVDQICTIRLGSKIKVRVHLRLWSGATIWSIEWGQRITYRL